MKLNFENNKKLRWDGKQEYNNPEYVHKKTGPVEQDLTESEISEIEASVTYSNKKKENKLKKLENKISRKFRSLTGRKRISESVWSADKAKKHANYGQGRYPHRDKKRPISQIQQQHSVSLKNIPKEQKIEKIADKGVELFQDMIKKSIKKSDPQLFDLENIAKEKFQRMNSYEKGTQEFEITKKQWNEARNRVVEYQAQKNESLPIIDTGDAYEEWKTPDLEKAFQDSKKILLASGESAPESLRAKVVTMGQVLENRVREAQEKIEHKDKDFAELGHYEKEFIKREAEAKERFKNLRTFEKGSAAHIAAVEEWKDAKAKVIAYENSKKKQINPEKVLNNKKDSDIAA